MLRAIRYVRNEGDSYYVLMLSKHIARPLGAPSLILLRTVFLSTQ